MMTFDASKRLVLFSGGQDSATCLAHALAAGGAVETVGFFYGQRHDVEMVQRKIVLAEVRESFPEWAARLGEDHLIDLSVLGQISDTALTREADIAMGENGLPNTFVPGRNLVFLTFAAALAYRRGAGTLVGGMCETDYSGYPDCREEALAAMTNALRLGMDADFQLETPLMHLSKAESWALAEKLGGAVLVEIILEHTHTCYRGDRSKRHDWGYGCGECPACELRAAGYKVWRAAA